MEVNLNIINNERCLQITNTLPYNINWEVFWVENNIGNRMPTIKPGHWYNLNLDLSPPTLKNAKLISFFTDNGELFSYRIEKNKIFKIEPDRSVPLNSPFICITGYQGSGTSIVLKSLRYFGCHAGDDCGDFDIRKAHESVVLRIWNNLICCKPYDKKVIEESFYNALGSYNYHKNKINIFKDLHIGDSKKLVEFIPNIKFISVIKHQDKNYLTPEGKNFSEASKLDILKTQNPQLEGQSIFHLDWNRYFTNIYYCQKLLTYVGLNIKLDKNKFNQMLKAINFDKNKLKND